MDFEINEENYSGHWHYDDEGNFSFSVYELDKVGVDEYITTDRQVKTKVKVVW